MFRISFPSSPSAPLSLSTLRLLRQPAQRTEKRRRHGYLLSRRRSAKNFSHAVSSHRHRAEVPEDVTLHDRGLSPTFSLGLLHEFCLKQSHRRIIFVKHVQDLHFLYLFLSVCPLKIAAAVAAVAVARRRVGATLLLH